MRTSDWSSDVCSSDVSAGGGAVGMPLFRCAVAARPLSAARDLPWRILVSRQEDSAEVRELQQLAGPGVIVEPVRPDFPSLLRRCRLSNRRSDVRIGGTE